MLQRVSILNYKIFNTKQQIDFRDENASISNPCKLFTFVGENGCGKSTFLHLIGLASNLDCMAPLRELRVCDGSQEALVKCEYSVDNWDKLRCVNENRLTSSHPELKCWFLDGILMIPKDLQQFLQQRLDVNTDGVEMTSCSLTVVTGFKHIIRSLDSGKTTKITSRFLYVKFKDRIIVFIQALDGVAKVGIFTFPAAQDMMDWIPDESILEKIERNFLASDAPCSGLGQITTHYQCTMISDLVKAIPTKNRDEIWKEVRYLFHELTGDEKITVKLDQAGSVIMQETLNEDSYHKPDLPEGFFIAFLVAFLLVSPLTQTILLDEPSRGMHPLQIRRLRRILSQQSTKRKKIVVITSHAPEMLHGSPIERIFRFRRFGSGYSEIRCVPTSPSNKDSRFITSTEARELFFTRRVIWVEGDTDRRFCDAMMKMIDEGNELLWNALKNPEQQRDSSGSLGKLFASPVYQTKAYSEDILLRCQESARTCSVLPLMSKRNMTKVVQICGDLNVPHCAIIDLDAILPGSKLEVKEQFDRHGGDWTEVAVNDTQESSRFLLSLKNTPASACVTNDPLMKKQLLECQNALKVMQLYEKAKIFAWRVGGGEIEHVVQITRSGFKKEHWREFSFEEYEELVKEMLDPKNNGPNPELLRCFCFLLQFLENSNG